MNFLKRFFTWWNGQTLATQFWTWRKGIKVGEDEAGNVYYQTHDSKRRWVIFNGNTEASRVSADWHGWLHFTYKEPPTDQPLSKKGWEKPHQENLTGTPDAYAPKGSMRNPAPKSVSDYEAWQPE